MPQAITIDFISDVACPWCAIGLSALQQALQQFGDTITPTLNIHPFELNPGMKAGGEDIVHYLGKKYGKSPAEIAQTQAMIAERGASVGFFFGQRSRTYNTFDAHRLIYWAGEHGKQVALKMAILQAYHGAGEDPGNTDVLCAAAGSVGLDEVAARRVLDEGQYATEVRAALAHNEAIGIQSVPAVILNQRYLVSGGQPVDVFVQAIQQALDEAATLS